MPAAYTPTTDFTVAPSQVLNVTDEDAVRISQTGSNPPPNIALQGGIGVIATTAYLGSEIHGVLAIGDFTGADFTLAFQSRLSVIEDQTPTNSAPDLDTYGIISTASPNLTISGNILVAATGQATGIVAPFSTPAGHVTLQQGVIEAVSVDGAAYGVRMDAGGSFQNNLGSIEATAHTVAVGLWINGDHGFFYNHGTITADAGQSGPGGYGIAVEWKSASVAGSSGSFVNDGLLMGDYALVARADVVNPLAIQTFINNGAMVGDVDLGDAPTQFSNNGRIDGDISFGASNDVFHGEAGTVTGSILGGGGDDFLVGGASADTILGGDGKDIIDGGAGANHLDGGAGDNGLSFGSAGVGVSIDLTTGSVTTGADTETFTNFQQVVGSAHADTITGTAGSDTINAGDGDDLVYATNGLDVLNGGIGIDTISFERLSHGVEVHFADGSATGLYVVAGFDVAIGSALADTLVGGALVYTIYGGAGADSIVGQDSANCLRGDDGNDTIIGGSAYDNVNGNKGDDSIDGGAGGGDWLLGGQGNDAIAAHAGDNILNGNLGADTILGGLGADSLRGGQGDDVIHAGSGNNWISGDLGNNTIYGGQGADTFHVGAGHDVVNGWHAGDQVQVATDVTYTVTQVSADVHIVFSNGGEMDLLNTQQGSLVSGWIVTEHSLRQRSGSPLADGSPAPRLLTEVESAIDQDIRTLI